MGSSYKGSTTKVTTGKDGSKTKTWTLKPFKRMSEKLVHQTQPSIELFIEAYRSVYHFFISFLGVYRSLCRFIQYFSIEALFSYYAAFLHLFSSKLIIEQKNATANSLTRLAPHCLCKRYMHDEL